MLTKYFMRGINIRKYSNVFSEECVFSHVGCLSLLGFDEMSEAIRKTRMSQAEKAEQERKRLQNVYAPMLRIFSCVLLSGKVKLFLEVEIKRMSSWKTRVYIGNPCHVVGSKCTGLNQRCGRSYEHKSCDFPDQ